MGTLREALLKVRDKPAVLDKAIRSGEFSQYEPGVIGSPEEDYHKCNLFNAAAAKLWDIAVPRMQDETGYSEFTSGGVRKSDWPDNPMMLSGQSQYYENRSQLRESGVTKVSAREARSKANKGDLVFAYGRGHASVVAPHKKWLELYRPDLAFRGGDKRTRVGVREKGKNVDFYAIEPKLYNEFNAYLKRQNMAERDIASFVDKDDEGRYTSNPRYYKLRELFGKKEQ